ncbi:transposable element Tcb2 transposase [Trichonephila clavipes]|nr:transposable element Tcb2 transposase [Trichonephila clavipes]
MGKVADLSDFDRLQIAMARRLGLSISETARLVGCSRSTVVSTYAKWMNDSESSSIRHGVGRPHAINEKGRRRLSRTVKQTWSQIVAQLTAQYNARPSRIVSEHTVQWTLLYMGLRIKRPTRVPLLTKCHRQLHPCAGPGNIATGPWISGRELPGQMNHGLTFITPMAVSGYAVFQAIICFLNVRETLSWASLRPVVVVEQTMNATRYLNIFADQLHLYMTSVFPAGNGMFQQVQVSCHKAKNCV